MSMIPTKRGMAILRAIPFFRAKGKPIKKIMEGGNKRVVCHAKFVIWEMGCFSEYSHKHAPIVAMGEEATIAAKKAERFAISVRAKIIAAVMATRIIDSIMIGCFP